VSRNIVCEITYSLRRYYSFTNIYYIFYNHNTYNYKCMYINDKVFVDETINIQLR